MRSAPPLQLLRPQHLRARRLQEGRSDDARRGWLLRTCSFPGCDRDHCAKGLCSGHYEQLKAGKSLRPIRRDRTMAERFWSHVAKGDGCWEWQSVRKSHYKRLEYGIFYVGGRKRFAHRTAWELEHGPIPTGLCVLHCCDNPPCVRPDHLKLGTIKENNRDRSERGRYRGGPNAPNWIRRYQEKHAP